MAKKNHGQYGLHFQPWVGHFYRESVCRVMGLGESHYCASQNDDSPNMTIDIIKDFIDPHSEHEPYKNTYTKFTRALAGYSVPKEERWEFWEYIMFYNYVQVPISGPRVAPSFEQFLQSETSFWSVITQYRPQIIICWGKRLYENLPKDNIVKEKTIVVGAREVMLRNYCYGTHSFWVIKMTHPSSSYSWNFWHSAINEVVKKYGK